MKKSIFIILSFIIVLFSTSCAEQNKTYKIGVGTELVFIDNLDETAAGTCYTAAVVLDGQNKIVDYIVKQVPFSIKIYDGFLESGAAVKEFDAKLIDGLSDTIIGSNASDLKGIEFDNSAVKSAIVKAVNDEQAKQFKTKSVNLKMYSRCYVDSAVDSKADDGVIKLNIDVAAVSVDKQNRLSSAIIDTAQPSFNFDNNGVVTAQLYQATKRELKDNYGMVAYAGAIADWYVQSDALTDYLVGLTADEIISLPVDSMGRPTDSDLKTSCTIKVNTDIVNIASAMKG